ncbi:TauD/TfdA family dioxygenase [Virgifigura deserti]|uniref:TauD/TfdA family dioxygenase n=1 Tax=Virgifigura deserti TaxID=2268457 RepID=UPI003CCBB122
MLTMTGSEIPSDTRAEAIDMRDLAAYPTDRRIVGARCEEGGVIVDWDDGRQSRFHAVWLRDNCACSACRHPQAMERQFLLIDAPERITIQEAQTTLGGHLLVRFGAERPGDAPHVSRFDAGWLRHHCYSDWARAERAWHPRSWNALGNSPGTALIPTVEYKAVMETDAGLAEWLTAMRDWGVVLLRNAPAEPGEGLRIAGRVGPVRPTNFGTSYDVVSMPNPNASAYTPIGLEPHTDLANWRWPPDFQLLFCVANEAEGGGSILVDGFSAAEELRRCDPEAFDLLSTQPIDFRFQDETCDIRHRAPAIELDHAGAFKSIRFNNWLRAALDLPEAKVEPTYRALRTLWGYLRDPRFQLRPRLAAGEMLAFDNARVLHGREPFDPNTGRRHLQGCYLDRDLVLSRLRLLERRRMSEGEPKSGPR